MTTSCPICKKTILIVDDEEELAFFLEKILKRDGYEVLTARNGKEAVERYKSHQHEIDLILMDISMPVMNGLEAARVLKELDSCIPVILMSAYSYDSIDSHDRQHILQKPIPPAELSKIIKLSLHEPELFNSNISQEAQHSLFAE